MTTTRRQLLGLAGTAGLAALGATATSPASARTTGHEPPVSRTRPDRCRGAFTALERRHQVRLGVTAWDTATGDRLSHRAHERFPIMSVFKVLAAGCLMRDHDDDGHVLADRVLVRPEDLVANSPITGPQVGRRLSYAELCDAALRYSDNTAGNLLLRRIGGPAAITRFARTLGDPHTRLDRTEPTLNTAIPGDPRDTTTPADVARDLARLLLHDGRRADLPGWANRRLRDWMLANTTSGERFRSVLPAGWALADKTGSGDYGSANDVGVFYRPDGSAIVLAALSTKGVAHAAYDNTVLADTARLVLRAFG